MIPTSRPCLVPSRIQHTGQYAIVVPENMDVRVLVVNPTAAEVLKLCDGTVTVAGIVDRVASQHNVPRAQVYEDVVAFLVSVDRQGLLDSGLSQEDTLLSHGGSH
jgi:hypothetical protein